jgi:hypothetical protein
MSLQTAFVRNLLSAIRPWLDLRSTSLFVTDAGLITTNYLGSVFAFHECWHEIVAGVKGVRRFSRIVNGVDKHYFATSSPGPEFMIVRHGLLDRIRAYRTMVLSGFVKAVFGACFLILTVAMMDFTGRDRMPDIFWSLVAMFTVFPFFIISRWKAYSKHSTWALEWQHFAMHMNAVNLQEEEPIVSVLSRAFDTGFGDRNMYDILLALKKSHVAAWDAPGAASGNPVVIAGAEIESVRQLLGTIDSEFKGRRGKRDAVMESTLSIAQAEAIQLARSSEKQSVRDIVSFCLLSVAFYGYFVRILVYFFPTTPVAFGGSVGTNEIMSLLKLGCSDEFAIFWFKFIADVCFTLDPALDLKLISLDWDGSEHEWEEKIKQE